MHGPNKGFDLPPSGSRLSRPWREKKTSSDRWKKYEVSAMESTRDCAIRGKRMSFVVFCDGNAN